MDPATEPAVYLRGATIGLRAPLLDDAAFAASWYEGAPAHGRDAVEGELRHGESIPWGANPLIRLIAIEVPSGEIVGGVLVARSANRTSRLRVTCTESTHRRDAILRDILARVVPWLIDEVGVMTVVVETPADDVAMVTAAEAAGMTVAVRRRQHIRRERGRVDLLQLERVNREWGRYAG